MTTGDLELLPGPTAISTRPKLRTLGIAALAIVTAGELARRSLRNRAKKPEDLPSQGVGQAGLNAHAAAPFNGQTFLLEASGALGSTLDYDETVTQIASLAVPELADWCVIDLIGDDDVRRVRVRHGDPDKAGLATRLEQLDRNREWPHVATRVIETRHAVLVTEVPAAYLTAVARDPEHLETLKQLEVESLLGVPLIARGECLGAVVFVCSGRRRFTSGSLPVAEAFARRAATALANARLYRAAKVAIRARDEILAVVAHDLRSPLHVIEFAAERLRQNAPAEGRRSMDRSLDWIVSSTQRATSLVRDLLDRARLEWQAFALDLEPVEPADVVRDVARRAEPLAALASLQVRVDLATSLPLVQGDHPRLAQALENLVSNAMKFTPAGGSVTVGAVPDGEHVRFFVADTGQGIDPEHLDHVFDRFWKAKGADARGAGLGLFICKRIVEAHGGRVWVESPSGEGTTVSFTLPTI